MRLLLNIILILFLNGFWCEGRETKSVPCPRPKLKNGTVRMKNRGKGARFNCNHGFELDGQKNILCKMGRWDEDVPVCAKSGCESPEQRLHGQVQDEQTIARLYCDRGYIRSGNAVAYCDGRHWDRVLGDCSSSNVDTKVCNFEADSICDWTKGPKNDFQWVRKNGWKSFEKIETGPKHDHTTGVPLNGYYMVAEATNRNTANKSRLYSPIYDSADSLNACFRFYYHMYGAVVGTLRVYVKPLSVKLNDMDDFHKTTVYFEKQNSQGNHWNEGLFLVKPMNESFQIIFEVRGTRANSIFDIAIDDVALMNGSNCTNNQIEPSVAEDGGIYSIQTCADRCNETQSTIFNKTLSIMQPMVIINGSIYEKCDCHTECVDLDTCCLDYKWICDGPNEDYSSDTTIDTEITTMMLYISSTPGPINSSTKDTFSTSPIEATTTTTTTTPPTTPSKQTEQTTTTSILTTKTTSCTTPKNPTTMPTFLKKRIHTTITTSTPSVTLKLKTTNPVVISRTTKPITRIIKSKESTNINQNRPIPQSNESYFIPLSLVLVGCGMVVCSVGYFLSKYSNKWNRYNSQSIEYKSNYYSKRMEEPLVDDDASASGDYLNGAGIVEERPLDNLSNGNVAAARPSSQINFNFLKLAKIRRPTSQLKKQIDQFSDEQCLTEDCDEFIDFLPHTN